MSRDKTLQRGFFRDLLADWGNVVNKFFSLLGAFRKYGGGGRRPRELALRPAKGKPALSLRKRLTMNKDKQNGGLGFPVGPGR
jgi:hypothetical protein